MARLIDADKLHYIRKWFEDSNKSEVVVFAKEIDKAPTVDAVPVIRCRDCMYWRGNGKYCEYDMSGLEDDYCSWAERNKK